jgi:hypothetical protein
MFNPIPPREPDPPERSDEQPERIPRRKEIDIRHRRFQNGEAEAEMTGGDWALAVLCSVIGCFVGLVYLVQNKPKAGKMIGVSILCSVVWSILRFIVVSSLQQPQVRF